MKSCFVKVVLLMLIPILLCDTSFADDADTNYACDVTPTARSAASGNWNDPNVWDTGKVPDKGDWVLVNAGHTLTISNAIDLDNGGICNKGVMQTSANILDSPATRIEIQATAVQNSGEISGQNGKDGVCGWTSYCEKYNICDLATYNKQSKLLPNKLPIPPIVRFGWFRFRFFNLDWRFKRKNIPLNQHATSGSSIQIHSNCFVNDAVGKILSGNGGNDVQTCRDRAWSQAGSGGNIEIISPAFINEGNIESGRGGYAQSYHTTSKGGNGGNLFVLSDVSSSNASTSLRSRSSRSKRDGNTTPTCGNCASDSYTSDSRNSGCCTAGDGGNAQTQAGLGSSGKGGDISLFLQELGGKVSGKSGSTFSWDPTEIKASSCLQIQNFDAVQIFTDLGGKIDLTQLQSGAISAKVITIITKALNGQGGTIDLRGLASEIFKADEKIELFVEQLLLDKGINLKDLMNSPDLVVSPGKTVNQVLWSGEHLITGKAGTLVSIPLTLINIASSTDTYTLSIKDSAGWNLGTFPSDITLEGFKAAKLTLDVVIPEEADKNDVITITAVSKKDPAISATIEIKISIPGVDEDDDNSRPGVFKVDDTGIVKIDWLYDGGKYQGEFGIFNIAGMDNLPPGSPEFIAEAVKRVLSNSDQGYVVFSDLSEGARFSGLLGGEIRDWNAGPYKGVKSFAMNPGDQFATVLVPNSTFAALAQNPATEDLSKRPLFSIVSQTAVHGMYIGQMADINGMGKAYAYEDKDAAISDWDFNDLIVQITGASTVLPAIDELKADPDNEQRSRSRRDTDWRTSDLGSLILAHVESPAPNADTISMTVTLNAPATLLVYDPTGKVIGKEGGYIAGADFELKADGTQTITLPNPTGSYRVSVQGAAQAQSSLIVKKMYHGGVELSSNQIALNIAPHQILTTTIAASDTKPPSIAPVNAAMSYDFNGDGVTDNEDVSMLVKHWNSCRGQQKYDVFFDVNDDGCITVADIMTVLNAKTVK